jgi:hypothetical protein
MNNLRRKVSELVAQYKVMHGCELDQINAVPLVDGARAARHRLDDCHSLVPVDSVNLAAKEAGDRKDVRS